MRNDNLKWQPSNATPQVVEHAGNRLTCLVDVQQTLVSGPRQSALSLVNTDQCSAWPELASGDHYALSMRRDRILLVGNNSLPHGWLVEPGLAVSDVSGQYQVLELQGPQALSLLQQGTELDVHSASASTARLWHGYGVLLYRHQRHDCFRIHVSRGHFDALWQLLCSLLQQH